MPASRRRGERWRETLDQIRDRGGSLEITIDRREADAFRTEPGEEVRQPPPDLLWRVRVRQSGDDRILVEHPAALGRTIDISKGQRLVCVMSVGQNRWIFTSTVLAVTPGRDGVLELEAPERVERATRRTAARVSTSKLNLPEVRCWLLRDPITAVPAEAASRDRITELLAMPPASRPAFNPEELDSLGAIAPDVGAGFKAELANIGGGGIGLKVGPENSALVESSKLYWTRLDLRPTIPAPLDLISRIAHTHLDSEQNVYAGLAFEFGLDPTHKAFVADQIERFMRHAGI
jgi:hypothetical protein